MAVVVNSVDNLKVKARRVAKQFFKRALVLYQSSQDTNWGALTATERWALQAEINRYLIAALVLVLWTSFPAEVAGIEFDTE